MANASRSERRRNGGAGAGSAVGGAGPCIALLELGSIAAGFETADALRKEAAVEILDARAVSPGKYLILFTGAVEEVASALRRGLETGAATLLDSLFIPNVEPTLLERVAQAAGAGSAAASGGSFGAVGGAAPRQAGPALDAAGIIETHSVASTIRAADIASKTASLRLGAVRLAAGIGGKSYVTFTGEVSDVTAAVEAGSADAERAGMLVRKVVIPRPHADMAEALGL